jgi:hypothetical protein
MKKILITLLLLLCLCLVASCSCGHRSAGAGGGARLFPVPIADIVDNPQQYADRDVTVKGKVWDAYGVGKLTVFTLVDHTGAIAVYSSSSMAPAEGTAVKVTGRVHLVFRFGDRSMCYIKQNPIKD